jgi:hypothetical protein
MYSASIKFFTEGWIKKMAPSYLNMHRYCAYNTLLNARIGLKVIGTGDGR